MNNYFGEMLKVANNEYGAVVSDGVEAGDVESFIDRLFLVASFSS